MSVLNELCVFAAMDRVINPYQNGVDHSLLAENLLKTPEERVRALMSLQRLAREARRAGEQLRGAAPRTSKCSLSCKR